MFSPVGYLSLKELENRAKSLNSPWLTSADFHGRISNLPDLFAASSSGVVTRISLGVLAVGNDGEYAFLNRGTWAIDLKNVRDGAGEGNELGVGVWMLAYEPDAADLDPLWRLVEDGFADLLVSFEGQALVVAEDDAKKLLNELESFIAPPAHEEQVQRFQTENELEAWYTDSYIPSLQHGNRPTANERDKAIVARDGVELGDKRERARRIRRRSEPPGWENSGRPKSAN